MIEWRRIGEFGNYSVSSTGEIRNDKTGKPRKLVPDSKGYLRVGMYLEGSNVVRHRKVHRLVAKEFIGDSALQVNHRNGVKCDNRVENLEYMSCRDNVNHSWDTGLCRPSFGNRKLSEDQVREIRDMLVRDRPQAEIAQTYGVSITAVSRIKLGKAWKSI